MAATVPFDIQGDTHVLEFELTGTLDGSTFRGFGIGDDESQEVIGGRRRQVWDRSYGAIDIQGDSGDSFPC